MAKAYDLVFSFLENRQIPQTQDPRSFWSSLVVQWVKAPALSLQQLWSLLCCGFQPWPRNFHMPWVQPKKKKKKKKKKNFPQHNKKKGGTHCLSFKRG